MRTASLAAGWAWAAAIVWLSLIPQPPGVDMPQADKLGHLAAYGLLMLWFSLLHAARRARLAYAAGFMAMGVGLEFVQGALGYRSFERYDMAANTLGVLLGWAAAALWQKIRAA